MIRQYIIQPSAFPFSEEMPWAIIGKLSEILYSLIDQLDDGYEIKDGVDIDRGGHSQRLLVFWYADDFHLA